MDSRDKYLKQIIRRNKKQRHVDDVQVENRTRRQMVLPGLRSCKAHQISRGVEDHAQDILILVRDNAERAGVHADAPLRHPEPVLVRVIKGIGRIRPEDRRGPVARRGDARERRQSLARLRKVVFAVVMSVRAARISSLVVTGCGGPGDDILSLSKRDRRRASNVVFSPRYEVATGLHGVSLSGDEQTHTVINIVADIRLQWNRNNPSKRS